MCLKSGLKIALVFLSHALAPVDGNEIKITFPVLSKLKICAG